MKYKLSILLSIITISFILNHHIYAEERKKLSVQDIKDRIYLVLDIPKSEVYVNEKVPVNLKLYSDWLDLEEVMVLEPLAKGLVTGKFIKGDPEIIAKDGTKYVVLEFKKWFFGPEPGRFVFEPVEVKCNIARRSKKDGKEGDLLNDNEDFYNRFLGRRRYRSLELTTDPFPIRVLPLPLKGRPESFRGAVGVFTFDLREDWTDFESNNIVRFVIRIAGDGNYNTVNMPEIPQTDGISLYDSRKERFDDHIIFEESVKVQPEVAREIPAVKFSFFNPGLGEYVLVQKGPFDIEGKKRRELPEKAAVAEKEKPREEWITALKGAPGRFYKEGPVFYRSGGFIFLQFLPLIVLSAALVEHRRRWILTSDSEYAVYIRASRKARHSLALAEKLIKQGKVKEFYDLTFNMLQEYIGERFSLPSGSITEVNVDDIIGTGKGLRETAEKIKNVFADCYLARYTLLKPKKDDITGTFDKVKEVIDLLNEAGICKM